MPLLLLLFLILLLFLKKNPELKKIYFIATLAHLFILASIYLFLNPGFHGILNDGDIYSDHAGVIALVLKGINLYNGQWDSMGFSVYGNLDNDISHGVIPQATEYGIGYITYLYSAFYAAYGYSPVYIIISNIMLNLLTGAIIFKICDMLFNRKTAFIALVLFLFNPVSLYYSTTLLKDVLYNFVFYLSIYWAILSVQKRNIIYFLLIIPLLVSIQLFKVMFLKPFLLVISIYFGISLFSRKKLLFIVAPILVVLCILQFDFISAKWEGIFLAGAKFSRGFLTTPSGTNYDHSIIWGHSIPLHNNIGKIIYLANSWYHLIFEPILSKNISFGLLVYYPFKLIFVLLSFSSIAGIFISFWNASHYHRENILLVSFLFLIGSGLALSSGNVGTMLRHRDIITPVIFIYASYFFSVVHSRIKPGNYFKSTDARIYKTKQEN